MATKRMRQVTKEEFEILTRFHPGEIRYYADINTATNRHQGAKVSVKRKPSTAPTNGASAPAPARGSRRGYSKHLQLTTGEVSMQEGSLQFKVYKATKSLFDNDPTRIMTRRALTVALARNLPECSQTSHIVPTISGLIKRGALRYTGESSKV